VVAVSEKDLLGLGAQLNEARKATGRSEEDVARALLLDASVIHALETEDFDVLPEPTYVRGYIRSYARQVGLNPDELLELYAQLGHDEPEWEINEPARHEVAQGRKFRHITAIVFVVILGLLVTWLLTEGNGHKDMDEESAAPVEEVQPAASDEPGLPEEAAQPEPIDSTTLSEQSESDQIPVEEESLPPDELPVEEQVAEPEPEPEPEPVKAVSETTEDESLGNFSLAGVNAEGKDRISLTFTGDSWVEIVDANKVQVLRGLFKKGVARELVGSAPFSVFLGNTQGVEIKINGQPFDPAPYTRRDSTSRFTLKAP
jgi:cytoskeleton protein RodZ